MTESFLLALHLTGRRVVVVGASAEAARRAERLSRAGARVRVVCPREPCDELRALANVDLSVRDVEEADLDDAWLAVLADRDAELARHLAGACESRRVFFCAVDQPEHGSFSHVAVARAGSLSVAIATEGRAPALARRLREELERVLAEGRAAELVDDLAELRERTPGESRARVLGEAVAGVRIAGKLERGD